MGRESVKRARVVLDKGTPELVAAVEAAKIPVSVAAAIEHYHRQQKLSLESANLAGEVKVRAERRIGELLIQVPRVRVDQRSPGRPKKTGAPSAPVSSTPLQEVCEKAGIKETMRKDCMRLAAIPAPVFEAALLT